MKYQYYFLAATSVACLSAPAIAGDTVIYAPPAKWVAPKSLDDAEKSGPAVALLDKQIHMEGGTVSTYQDSAIRLSTPTMLTQAGTIKAQWMPDKGDLIVHRIELIRDGKTIDLIKQGAKFEVLRREKNLEKREVDGSRTATLVVPGAQVGDILRISYTITLKDQALGQQMQAFDTMPTKPLPLETGSLSISWPTGEPVRWATFHGPDDLKTVDRNGTTTLTIDLPLPKVPDGAQNAPVRFNFPPIVQATTFADWNAVSKKMASVFDSAVGFGPNSPLNDQVKAIKSQTDDPLAQAVLATRLVQDKISYLLNGMNGGNYIPQKPDETWEQRYGDCKAKSVLLLSLLKALGIKAEPFLVLSNGGDTLPDLLPMPGDFDHVVVHATIAGKEYWLDGTTSGTRLANIATVPNFRYGLPLREEGADLMALPKRLPEAPTQQVTLTYDSSAGIYVPVLYNLDIALSGPIAATLRTAADQLEGDALRSAVISIIKPVIDDSQPVSTAITYDDASGIAHITASGIRTTPWNRNNEVTEMHPPATPVADISFDADRARAEWKDVPLLLTGPTYQGYAFSMLLPDGGKGFSTSGKKSIDTSIAGIEIKSEASLSDGKFTLDQSVRAAADELPAADIPAAARSDAAISNNLPKLEAPAQTLMNWDYVGARRKLLAPIEAAYAKLIANDSSAEPSEQANDYESRASFRWGTGDLAGAESDYDVAIEKSASVDLYYTRGSLKWGRGDLPGALADYRAGESLEGKGKSYSAQVMLLGRMGKGDEALALAKEYANLAKTPANAQNVEAEALMWAGQRTEGLALIRKALTRRPGDPQLLNNLCWQAGIWNMVDAEIMATCNTAVEKSNWAAPELDSRAMAYFRQGKLAEAKADYDAALEASPWIYASRFMRGVVRIKMGDKAGGEKDIAEVLRMNPDSKARFAAFGIVPGK
ncbi:DUF3857 domain-containing protein [Tsuneonella mangrovi]|uniref:DUF3857 domain-containing protein n=1 Tax=Tsuneonella mangrovi TaxID=1982042 RepID=UPI000BA2625F|nr:DUF3857 domain-containing protein [Tsuneonella mangrovi]